MTTSFAPTLRQLEVLAFIAARIDDGLPPTIREIAERFGIRSTNAVNDVLAALERKGCLERGAMKARSMRIRKLGRAHLESVPLGLRTVSPEVAR